MGGFLKDTHIPRLLPQSSLIQPLQDQLTLTDQEAQASSSVVLQELLSRVSRAELQHGHVAAEETWRRSHKLREKEGKTNENREKTKDSTRTEKQLWLSNTTTKEY